MKRIIYLSLVISHLSFVGVAAQNALWATGSAVPEGTQQLVKRPNGLFAFKGPLNAGELKVMTTATYQKGVTQFLKPQLVDSYLINNGLNYTLTTDETQPGWVVSFQEDTYYFVVNTSNRQLKGQLQLPWNELLMAGSAFRGGSDNVEWKRERMSPFVRDHENPYVFTWEGYLGIFNNVVEPGYFKLEGQMTWGPRELHPYTHGEDILTSKQVCIGGDDNKWKVTQQGNYRITVNLYDETISAELLDGNAHSQEMTGIDDAVRLNEKGERRNDKLIFDLQGRRIDSSLPLKRGIYIINGKKVVNSHFSLKKE